MTDQQILQSMATEDRSKGIEVLFNRYTHLVFGVCMKYLKNPTWSEDAAMDVFEKLLQGVDRYNIKDLRSWLYTVTKNHCFKLLKRQLESASGEFSEISFPRFMENDVEEDHMGQRLTKLDDALNQLKDEQKQALVMFYYQGKSYKVISSETSWSENKVKSYIQNGKRNLKLKLEANE